MEIKEFKLPRVPFNGLKGIKLYPPQKELFEKFNKQKSFILVTPTGSGKTMAATLPIFFYSENALFIYPTNVLIENQVGSILKICNLLGKSYHFLNKGNFQDKVNLGKDFIIIKIDGPFLEKVARTMRYKTKGEALNYLISNNVKPTIILTNPDILYLIMTLSYSKSAEIAASLQKIDTIVIDEFHIYSGLELVNILTLIFLSQKLNIGRRKILLSATPDNISLDQLKSLLSPQIIQVKKDGSKQRDLYTVVHKVNISGIEVDKDNKLNKIINIILEHEKEMREKRGMNNKPDYVPTLVILNSVVEIIKLEEELLKNGLKQEEIVPIRGLMDKSERKIKDRTLVVLGTSAIEIGIDFSCDYLIFEASDASSFLQRFGRVGRHKEGKAILLGDYREAEIMKGNKQISREEFADFINGIYDVHNAFSWFVKTKMGLFVAYAIFKRFLDAIDKDYNLDKERKEELYHTFDNWFEEYGRIILGNAYEDHNKSLIDAKNLLKKQNYYKWPKIFYENLSFRSSLQSVNIYVKSEEQKGRNPMINTDALSIFKYGNNIKWNDREKRLEVDNFLGKHKVSMNLENLNYNDCGEILVPNNKELSEIRIKQDDHFTPLSYIIDLDKQIIIFLPKEIRNHVSFDWRFQPLWCDDRKSIAIIGGMALIALELYNEKAHNLGTPDETIIF